MFFLSALFLLSPAGVFAADLEIQGDSLVVRESAEQNQPLQVEVTVSNLSEESSQAEVVFLWNEEEFARQEIVLEPNERREVSVAWEGTADTEGGLTAQLQNQQPADENALNDVVRSFDIVTGQAPLAAEEVLTEPVLQTEVTAESQMMIHSEQLSWNTFRFRPSYRIGTDEVEVEWQFGDGQKAAGRVVTHTYNGPGNYHVQLRLIDQGATEIATSQVHVGFFHLANWRLWVLLLLLALIIIVAAIIAGVTDDLVDHTQPKKIKKKEEASKEDEETVINTLTDSTGELDSLAALGKSSERFSEDLAFLEELEDETMAPESAKPKRIELASEKPQDMQAQAIPVVRMPETEETGKKKPASSVKKKSSGKKTQKKKSGSKTKKSTAKKKSV